MKRLAYISVFLLFVFVSGCVSHSDVMSIYSVGIYDVQADSEDDIQTLERYLRSEGCLLNESFVTESGTIQENNRQAAEIFRAQAAKIDYDTLRGILRSDVAFTYAVVCGYGMRSSLLLESVEFSPGNKE